MWESRGRVALGFLVTVTKERPKLVSPGVLFDLVCLMFYFRTVCVETYLNFLFTPSLQRVCWVLRKEPSRGRSWDVSGYMRHIASYVSCSCWCAHACCTV